MAYLAVSFKLLIIGGTLAVVTDSETTLTYQVSNTSNIEQSTSMPVLENTFNSTATHEENLSPTMDGETATSSQSPDNYSSETTDTYSNVSTGLSDNSSFSHIQREYGIPDNTSSSNTTDETISTELQVLTNQTSDPQESSAATTTSVSFAGTSSSKVSSTQEFLTVSTPNSSPVLHHVEKYSVTAIIIAVIVILILIISCCLLSFFLYRRKHRYSFDLSHKTAEDANIPLSSPILPGGFELTPDKENKKEGGMVNEDKTNHEKTSSPALNVPEESNEKQNNCETEINHPPDIPEQENTDTLDDWNFKSAASSFTDINLMDCATAK
ncbi:uncharacterized protein LOC127585962 [Pristis pectinata]|uniref:uncharacterized protein LOC127585962 n=1 Tax=Pristis pectinata TaxID=685728 RepID=UPI00223D0D26|nr:uncharacterized protein LOC127585962 [Pristis pectinata]XP_051899689.1 uncharacterized protein LOC127585962 [Pristis pectinata]